MTSDINKNTDSSSAINQFLSASTAPIIISDAAAKRILEIRNKAENKNKNLRITVSGGGCSGFQYHLTLDDNINPDDLEINYQNQVLAVTDNVSLDFLRGCTVDYISDLGGSFFKINNPNATASCGCGSSFSV